MTTPIWQLLHHQMAFYINPKAEPLWRDHSRARCCEIVAQDPGELVLLGSENHFTFAWVSLSETFMFCLKMVIHLETFFIPVSITGISPFLCLTHLYLSLSPSHSSISLSFSVSLVCICISRYLSFSFCRLFMRLLVAMFTAWNAQPWLAE